MSSQNPRVGQLDAVKMMAYQHIQQTKQKLVSRLAYLLLEHIVEQYQTNQYFRLTVAGSLSTAKNIIADAIQLYMQERIEQKKSSNYFCGIGQNKPEKEVSKAQQKQQNSVLQQRINELVQDNENVRNLYEKERRKISKLLQKYNCLSDMMFEVKQKSQNQIKDLQRSYQIKLQYLSSKNQQLKQQIVRLDVTLQFMTKNSGYVHPGLAKSPTQKTMSFLNYQQSNRVNEKNLSSSNVFSIPLAPIRKTLQFVSGQYKIRLQPETNSNRQRCKSRFNLIHSIAPQAKQNAQTETFIHLPKAICRNQCLNIQRPSSKDFQIQVAFNQTSVQCQTELQELELLQNCKEELRIANYLSSIFQKQSKKLKNNLIILQAQKMELIKISNRCIQENQQTKKQLSKQMNKLQLQVSQLQKHVQHVQKQNIDLLNLIQQFQLDASHSPTNIQESKYTQNQHSQSEHTQESSTQPKKENVVFFQLNANECIFDRRLNNQGFINEYIRKQTISRYFLQMLDSSCKGEAKLILLNQIGECLGWIPKDYERLEFYMQKARLKKITLINQDDSTKDQANLKDKIFNFLTNQSETQE